MIMRRTALMLVALAAVSLAASGARAVVIDDFTQAPIDLVHVFAQSSITRATQTGLDPSHVAGGVRAWQYNIRPQFNSDIERVTFAARLAIAGHAQQHGEAS